MKTETDYIKMQRAYYENQASHWSLEKRNPVVGSYDAHNAWADYDEFLFKDFDTSELVALDYGTGPGRNIVKFWDRFKRIDGVDLAKGNILKARAHMDAKGITGNNLFVCDGKSIPAEDESYDVVFSVICLQHICCYSIRLSIFKEAFRVLKKGGKLCFQMGYGGRPNCRHKTSPYLAESTGAKGTNGSHDVTIVTPEELGDDLVKIGFTDFLYDIRPPGPGCAHAQWIYAQFTKP